MKGIPKIKGNLKAASYFSRSLYTQKILKKPHPMSAVFVVCNRCNLTCKYCNSPFLKEKELSLLQIEKLFDKFKKMGIYRLGLTGGEPLLREDIHEIVDLAVKRKFFVSLNSNLLLYKNKFQLFKKLDFVFTSLDGGKLAHERNRGRGAFDGVLEAIADLRKNKTPVVAITVVDEHSFDELDNLIEFATRLDFKLHFQAKVITTAAKETNIIRGKFSDNFSSEKYRSIWQRLLQLKLAGKPIASSTNYLKSVIQWQDYRQITAVQKTSKCAAGFGYIYVNSEGFAFPCSLIKKSMSGIDLLESDWNTSYHGDKPCNDCIVGPYLELNLLYSKPLSAIADLYSGYALLDR